MQEASRLLAVLFACLPTFQRSERVNGSPSPSGSDTARPAPETPRPSVLGPATVEVRTAYAFTPVTRVWFGPPGSGIHLQPDSLVTVPAAKQVRNRDQCSFFDNQSESGGVGLG
jgi:hypothetical protein